MRADRCGAPRRDTRRAERRTRRLLTRWGLWFDLVGWALVALLLTLVAWEIVLLITGRV